ncbi:MAG: pyrroloquinoline quinone biosynthesis protein PqqB [Stackebrandtia sp.]
MRACLLGTAAGGGFPQWNCACRLCAACRAGDPTAPSRTQDGLALSLDGRAWTLVNASPDLRGQILAARALDPGPGRRETPITDVLLTDAELDHTLGLMLLRGHAGLRVWAPGPVLTALREQFPVEPITERYRPWQWREPAEMIGGIAVDVFGVSRKRPKYAADSLVAGDWVVAYRFTDPGTGGSLVYAPCLARWPAGFDAWLDGATYIIVDGTFYSPAEMSPTGVDSASQAAMGHLPIDGEDGTLVRARAHRGSHWLYTHLNNTNPVLDTGSPEHRHVYRSGARIPEDGTTIEV